VDSRTAETRLDALGAKAASLLLAIGIVAKRTRYGDQYSPSRPEAHGEQPPGSTVDIQESQDGAHRENEPSQLADRFEDGLRVGEHAQI